MDGRAMATFLQRYRNPVVTTVILCIIAAGLFVLIVPNFVMCGGPRVRKLSQRNACINNLRQIDGAKEQWALEHKKQPGDLIVPAEIVQYIKGGAPQCPAGGTYRYRKIDDTPLCSIKDHTIEQ
jgi:hypothetical protein